MNIVGGLSATFLPYTPLLWGICGELLRCKGNVAYTFHGIAYLE